MSGTPDSTQVLIAGAGPTGLSLAITCRRFGLNVRIVDRAPQASTVSKALAVWSGSMEALAEMGTIGPFLEVGVRMHSLRVGDGKRQIAEVKVGDAVDSPYPYALLLPQSRTERLLAARLAELGVSVERDRELTGFTADDAGVSATLRHGDGIEEVVRAAYLAGCDGARSVVRHQLGIDFPGYTEPASFLLCDAPIDGAIDPASIYIWWHRGGTVALFPIHDGVWRVFAKREGDGDTTPTIEEMQSHLDRFGPPGLQLGAPEWLSCFRINERVAAQYRGGRCFLLGDAAHIHSPAGGQGMNTGIQDAVNLGWKLGYALNGWGDAELLLSSYEPERRPVAHDVVRGAGQKQHLAFTDSGLMRVLRDVAIPVLTQIPAVRQKLQLDLSETEIVYRDGPLVALGDPPRRAGRTEVGGRARDVMLRDPASGQQRALWPLLAGPAHTLLLFGDRIAAPSDVLGRVGERLVPVSINSASDPNGEAAARYGLREGWVLVRPDQVVAARGTAQDWSALTRYARGVLAA